MMHDLIPTARVKAGGVGEKNWGVSPAEFAAPFEDGDGDSVGPYSALDRWCSGNHEIRGDEDTEAPSSRNTRVAQSRLGRF
ncbi:MAG TPA: hypothetical protein VMT89_01730 [Candidatus Acidoferrales bacterium]|nr:hypothetical protein [Candidatus Acidoferrales bacterium]